MTGPEEDGEPLPPLKILLAQTAFVVVMLVISVCAAVGRLPGLWSDFASFLTGAPGDIAKRSGSASEIFGDAFAAVCLMIPLMLVGILLARLTGPVIGSDRRKPIFHACSDAKPPKRALMLPLAFHKIAAIVFFEEFYARWLFLGVLAPLWSGPEAFYLLFLAGNILWTALHYWNHEGPTRRIGILAPVFCYGFLNGTLFVRNGLVGVFVAHFVWDILLMFPRWLGQFMKKEPLTL